MTRAAVGPDGLVNDPDLREGIARVLQAVLQHAIPNDQGKQRHDRVFGTWPWSAAGRGAPRRWAATMTDVELSAGVVEYRDTGGRARCWCCCTGC